jgi:hypothetical protein
LIQYLLHFGFVGLFLVITLLSYFVYDLVRINKSANICGVSLLAGLVGVFIIRGLLEGRYLSGLLFLVIIYLVQRSIVHGLSDQTIEVSTSVSK